MISAQARSNGAQSSKLLESVVSMGSSTGGASKKPKALRSGSAPPADASALGPPPDGELRHVASHRSAEQLPYVSPYDAEDPGQTVTF